MFNNRRDAGRQLGTRLAHLRGDVVGPNAVGGEDVVVLGLPRGGVPVAYEVAQALNAPLDVILVRKLGVPSQPELAMGAIADGGVRVLNDEVLRTVGVSADQLAAVEARERTELDRRARRFRGSRPPARMAGRIVIIVDDGIATGSTAAAACQVVRAAGAARVVLAVPVAPPERIGWLRQFADEVVCLSTPEMFFAIGAFYANFDQTSDDEVISLLSQATARTDAAPAAAPIGVAGAGERGGPGGPGGPGERRGPGRDAEVGIPAGAVRLTGRLTMPDPTLGIVVFAHGSGSSRHSPRNRYVAADLNSAGLATLLFDLLTPEEEADRANVFDIPLLARRLVEVTRWLGAEPSTRHQPIGYFGASTGAAAALWAAAEPGVDIAAVVSRGGRADLATPRLTAVRAPTLLIVGEHDDLVTELNNQARALLRCENRLAIVPTATHLFTEPGTLEQVAALARDWFLRHLAMAAPRVSG